jgi:RNA polymerase sigma-70 factor (ECF subfamily)
MYLSDSEIISVIRKSPSRGMKLLIDNYSPTVFAAVSGRLGGICSHDEIEACVSLVFTEFYFELDKFDCRQCSLKTYLSVLARNKAIEEFRRTVRRKAEMYDDDEALLSLPDSFDLERTAERHLMEQRLLRAVDSLGWPDSDIIIRRYFYSQPSRQIAAELGLTDAAVRKRISRSLARLRTILQDYAND